MCNPAFAVMALAMAASAAQQIGQQQEIKDANKAQSDYYKDTAQAANDNARNQYYALALRQQQEEAATSQEVQKANLQARSAAATAKAAAADSGISGLSVDALLAGYERSAALYRESTLQNLEMTNQQLDLDRRNVYTQVRSMVNQAKPQYTRLPSGLTMGLAIGKAGVEGYLGAGGSFDNPPNLTSDPTPGKAGR